MSGYTTVKIQCDFCNLVEVSYDHLTEDELREHLIQSEDWEQHAAMEGEPLGDMCPWCVEDAES